MRPENHPKVGPAVRCVLALATLLVLGSVPHAAPQSGPPAGKDGDIVINPTVTECQRGWDGGAEKKWSKPQFDQFCAVLKSPADIVVNPTLDECAKGWNDTTRWTRPEFDKFCDTFKKSK